MLLSTNHSFWWASGEMLMYLLVFAGIMSGIIFLLRGPMRKYKPADIWVFRKLERWHSPFNNRLALFFTYLGKANFLIPANLLLITIFVIIGPHYWFAFRMLVMSLSSLLLMFILKQIFHRKRPGNPLLYEARGKSFPSGHAIMAVNFYGLLFYMLQQTDANPALKIAAGCFAVILILAIGLSRIYLQVHYASDVLAGFIIGSCWFYTSLLILNRIEILMN